MYFLLYVFFALIIVRLHSLINSYINYIFMMDEKNLITCDKSNKNFKISFK